MIIPSKHSGYQAGVRRLCGGGGGGGGGEPAPAPPPARLPTAAAPPVYQTYGSGDRTGSLVQSGNSYRPSSLDYSKPIYDPNYADNITGYQDSSQFYQPIQQQQYANYTNPLTAFNVSSYGTNPGMSRSLQAATAPGAGGAGAYYKHLQGYGDLLSSQGDRNNINTLMQDMRQHGISAQDLQSAASYNPPSPFYGGGQQSMGMPNPFSYGENNYVDPYSGRSTGLANPTNYQQQQYNPFNYRQPQQQQYNPFSYQQPQQQYNPYQQQQYNPYQQQQYNPFSYQQPQPVVPTSSGPSQAIYGRSSAMRGTPNVMRRAEGGIAGILEK